MTSERPLLVLIVALALALVAPACADFTRGDPPPPPPDTVAMDVTGDTVAGDTYTGTIHDLLMTHCAQCHSSGAPRPFLLTGDADTDYDGTVALVDVGDPPSSALLRKTAGLDGHGPGRILGPTTADYLVIERWIADGAVK